MGLFDGAHYGKPAISLRSISRLRDCVAPVACGVPGARPWRRALGMVFEMPQVHEVDGGNRIGDDILWLHLTLRITV